MLLPECLSRVPNDQIHRMARFAGLNTVASRRELEERLASHLIDPDWLRRQADELGEDEWQALKVVYWGGGGQGITVELCHQVVNLLAGRRRQGAAQALLKLMDRGLIYSRKHAYRDIYFIPAELMPTLSRLLAARMAEQVTREGPGGAPPDSRLQSDTDLVEELYRFLAYVYSREVPLTQQGIIFKRHLRALTDLLGVENSPSDEDGLLPGRYPEPLGFLAGFCMDFHLITRDHGQLQAGNELDFWLRRTEGELRGALFEYWEERYYYPDLQSFLNLAKQVPDRWLSVAAAAAELEPVLHPSQRAPLMARLQHHLTGFLVPLGIFRMAHGPHDELLCHLTPVGRILIGNGNGNGRSSRAPEAGGAFAAGSAPAPEPAAEPAPAGRQPAAGTPAPASISTATAAEYQFILQPTGELVAPRPVALPVLWHLEVMADLERRGPALVYRISRDTIYRALKVGYTSEELVGFLERHSQTGVPQNLAFDISSWGRAYGQVFFQEVCLLRCSDPGLAQQIKAGRRTARYVHGEVSPTALIVLKSEYEALLQALLAEGLLPRPGIEQIGGADS